MEAPGGIFLYHAHAAGNKKQDSFYCARRGFSTVAHEARMAGVGISMKIQVGIAAVTLLAAVATFGAPQAKAPRDPEMIDIQGFQKLIEQNRGKALLVNFWATWCEPCRDEYPMLNELAKQYAPKGLQVVGVSMDDDGDLILMRRFLARYKPIFPNYRKTAGAEAAFRQAVLPGWTGSMPISIFYAKDGRQVTHFIGEKSREQYEEAIRALLADGGGTGSRGK
jgi:thiol-disulfide isomerase/thioredoxin